MAKITTIEELNEKKNECVYVMHNDYMIIGTTQKYDMDRILDNQEESLITISDDDLDETLMIHGIVLDPAELPFEIPKDIMKDNDIWLFIGGTPNQPITVDNIDNLEDLTLTIEDYIQSGYIDDITDVAVVLGTNVGIGLKVQQAGEKLTVRKVYNDS